MKIKETLLWLQDGSVVKDENGNLFFYSDLNKTLPSKDTLVFNNKKSVSVYVKGWFGLNKHYTGNYTLASQEDSDEFIEAIKMYYWYLLN